MTIAVGQRAVQEFPVDDHTIELFGEASTDRNPLHFDDAFAARRRRSAGASRTA